MVSSNFWVKFISLRMSYQLNGLSAIDQWGEIDWKRNRSLIEACMATIRFAINYVISIRAGRSFYLQDVKKTVYSDVNDKE